MLVLHLSDQQMQSTDSITVLIEMLLLKTLLNNNTNYINNENMNVRMITAMKTMKLYLYQLKLH